MQRGRYRVSKLVVATFIRRVFGVKQKKERGSLTKGGEKWRLARGMTCVHKRGEEIRNFNHCGMKMAL